MPVKVNGTLLTPNGALEEIEVVEVMPEFRPQKNFRLTIAELVPRLQQMCPDLSEFKCDLQLYQEVRNVLV